MEKILREDGREVDNIRKVNVIRNYTIHAEDLFLYLLEIQKLFVQLQFRIKFLLF